MKTVIRTEKLTKRFGDLTAVDAIDLDVHEGEVFGFLGPNGAGKTTTLRLLCALIAPTEGSAEIAGLRLGRDDDRIRGSVGILTEHPGLYERLTATENLMFFASLYGLDGRAARSQVERFLRLMGLWEKRDEYYGRTVEIRIVPSPLPEHVDRVLGVHGVREAWLENGSILVRTDDPLRTDPAVVRELVGAGADVAFVSERRVSLEDLYLKI